MTTSATSAFAVFDVSYAARTALISPAEFSNSPTAQDVMNLIAGTAQANATALAEVIGRASSWCDNFCFGAYGCIAATSQTETARTFATYRSTLSLHPNYWPLITVDAFAYSSVPGGLANGLGAASITPAGNITVYPQSFEVSSQSIAAFSGFNLSGSNGIVRGVQYDTVYTYSAGWVNTSLAASVAAGAESITPTSVVGIVPGSLMTLYDLPNDEPIQIASNYVPGSATCPLVNPTQYAHQPSATIANLPPAIKQACILATCAAIKQRGSGALIASDMGAAVKQQSGFAQNSGSDWWEAEELLLPFRQVYVGN